MAARRRPAGARQRAALARTAGGAGRAHGFRDAVGSPAREEDAGVAAELAGAIAQLTGSQQEALLLIAWDGLSEREAALALGCSRAAFAARLHRARARVRAAMAPPDGGRERALTQPSRFPTANSIEEAT